MTDERLPASKPLLRIEGYEIIREIGRGGQAFVYQARQETTNRKVAVKVLRKFAEANDEAAARFVREIRLMARLTHPNVVSILHAGQLDDGRHYYVMEYVRGLPVRQHVVERGSPVRDVLRLFASICRAVGHLHRHGVVHRDIKPSNVLVDDSGDVKILDFGLAKNVTAPSETMATTTGVVLGSLLYMSPEQARGQTHHLTPRTDVYSLGVVLFELLTGEFPFSITGPITDVIKRIMESVPLRPSEAWRNAARKRAAGEARSVDADCPIDATLDAICLRAMEKDAPLRYADADELADDVERHLAGEPTRARPERWRESLRRRFRHLVRRRRKATLAACAVAALLLANYPGIPLVFSWTPLNFWYERLVTTAVDTSILPESYQDTRMVIVTDATDISAVAAREGLGDVSPTDRVSLRRLHGRLMERLTASNCRVVIWDIMFPSPSRFDEDFVAGVAALRGVGIDVVVGVGDWWLDHGSPPEISPVIAPHVRWGCVAAALSANRPWAVPLVVQRGSEDPQMALALEGLAAGVHPMTNLRVDFPQGRFESDIVRLSFWEPGQEIAKQRCFLPRQLNVSLSAVRPVDALEDLGPGQFGLRKGSNDVVGLLVFNVPSDEVLKPAMLDYGAVFEADDQALQSMFAGRAVLIGDARPASGDLHPHPSGRTMPGVVAHATALEVMSRGLPLRMPRWLHEQAVPMIGVILGLIAGTTVSLRRAGILSVTGLAMLLAATAVVIYRQFGFLVNPMMVILPLMASWTMAVAVDRTARPA